MDIKTFRINNHLSVIKMAELVGVSRQHIYDLEKQRAYPSRKLAAKIQAITNNDIKASEILGIRTCFDPKIYQDEEMVN